MPKKRDKIIMPNTNDDNSSDLGSSVADMFADALLGGIFGSGTDDKDKKKEEK